MSAAAERRFEEKFKRVTVMDKRDFVVGATVYRAGYHEVETGKVMRVYPCRINQYGDPVEDPNGGYTAYAASFGRGACDWEVQTYRWRFFIKASVARAKLVEDIYQRIEAHKRDIVLLSEKIAEIAKEGIEVLADDRV